MMEILVINVIESIKWSESKQLGVYTFARWIVLVPGLALFFRLAVQTLLPVTLHWITSIDGSSCEYDCAWHQLKPYANFSLVSLRALLMFLGLLFLMLKSPDCVSLNTCAVRQQMLEGCLTFWVRVEVPTGLWA